MMKKVFSVVLALSLLLLCGCSQSDTQSTANKTNSQSAILQAESKLNIPSFDSQFKFAGINALLNRQIFYSYKTDDKGVYTTNAAGVIHYLSEGTVVKDKSANMRLTYKDFFDEELCKKIEGLTEGRLYYFSDELIITQKVTSKEIVVTDFNNKKLNFSFDKEISDAFVIFDKIWFTVLNETLTNEWASGEIYDVYSCNFTDKNITKQEFNIGAEVYFEKLNEQAVMYFYDAKDDCFKMISAENPVPEKVFTAPAPEVKCDDFVWVGAPVNGSFYYVTGCYTKLDTSMFADSNNFDELRYPTKSSGRVYIQKDGAPKLIYTDRKNAAVCIFSEGDYFYVVFCEETEGTKFVRQFDLNGKLIKQYDLTVKSAAYKRK